MGAVSGWFRWELFQGGLDGSCFRWEPFQAGSDGSCFKVV